MNGEQTTGQREEFESNSRLEDMLGFGLDYGSREARIALAVADANGAASGGGGPTTTPPADIAAGVDASADIDSILAELETLAERGSKKEEKAFTLTIRDGLGEVWPGVEETIELYVQNKSESTNVLVRTGASTDFNLTIVLYPGGSHTFTSFEATESLYAAAESGTVNIYTKRIYA